MYGSPADSIASNSPERWRALGPIGTAARGFAGGLLILVHAEIRAVTRRQVVLLFIGRREVASAWGAGFDRLADGVGLQRPTLAVAHIALHLGQRLHTIIRDADNGVFQSKGE
jgi:hypothetical protein